MKTKKINISHIINLVLLFVAGLVALRIYQEQNKKITEITMTQNEQKKKNEVLLRLSELKDKAESYKELFRPKDSREIINVITELAKASGVQITSLKPQISKLTTGQQQIYDKNYFNLTIETDGYHQLGKFISRLENSPLAFIVEQILIKTEGSGRTDVVTRPKKITVNLIISKFYFKE